MKFLRNLFSTKSKTHISIPPASTESVESYYERETEKYLEIYGDVIQATRASSDNVHLDYLIQSMGICDEMLLLDAGCGVCGPAIHFAGSKDVRIEAVTISQKQVDISIRKIKEAELNERINVKKGDFSNLKEIYRNKSFDIIYFLETLGYAPNFSDVIKESTDLLKNGGILYIKDFFLLPLTQRERIERQREIKQEVRQEYQYKILDFVKLIESIRKNGLRIHFIKPPDILNDMSRALKFEEMSENHNCFTKAVNNPYGLFETLELKLYKPF